MNRIINIFFFAITWISVSAQGRVTPQNSTSAKYFIDNQFVTGVSPLESGQALDLTTLQSDRTIFIPNTRSRIVEIPFLGRIHRGASGEIFQLTITDVLLNYGNHQVDLWEPIRIMAPRVADLSTGYTLTLAPEQMASSALSQLPILPDSVRITISSTINDSDWSKVSLELKNQSMEVRSFSRTMFIQRIVEIKIEPFGWESVNNIAPMIDWDGSYELEHTYIIRDEVDIPFAILEKKEGVYNIAVLQLDDKSSGFLEPAGRPTIKAIPNPVINDVRFQISNIPKGEYTIKIKNILGEVKIEKTLQFISSDLFPVNIDSLRKGSYFYVLEDADGNILSTKRLIVLKP